MSLADAFLSPRQVADVIGVSESSIKRWCDEGLLETIRTAGGHRKIPTGELLHFAREQGYQIAGVEAALRRPASSHLPQPYGVMADQLAEALLLGQSLTARQLIFDLFWAKHSVSVLCDNVIAAAFRVIGERWSCRQADEYQERRGCEIILRILLELYPYLQPVLADRLAIGATITGDNYKLPSAMAELTLRAARYQTQNLGTSLPIRSLVRAVQDLHPQIFWLSVSHLVEYETFIEEFAMLAAACAESGTVLIVGGRALTAELRSKLVYSAYCDTMQQLNALATSLIRSPDSTSRSESLTRKQSFNPTKKRGPF